MSKTLQMAKKAWSKLAHDWAQLRPPARPSQGEIKIYDEAIKRIKESVPRPKVLLLGATPELRDLLAKYKFSVTLVDINSAMVKATTKLLKRKNHHEKIIIGDWLKTKLPQHYYDIVIGDHVFSNVKFKKWHEFCQIINNLLRPSGYFLTNVQLQFPVKGIFPFEKLIDSYQKYPAQFNNIENRWQMLFKMMYSDKKFCGNKDYMILWPAIPQIQKFLKLMSIDMDIQQIAKLADYIYVEEFKYCSPPRKIFESILRQHFYIISSDINRKHPVYQSYRIYLAKNY